MGCLIGREHIVIRDGTMKRVFPTAAIFFLSLWTVGCCYRVGYVDQYTGMPYGGHWEPMPGGPFDLCCGYGGWGNPGVGVLGNPGCAPSYGMSAPWGSGYVGAAQYPQTFVSPGCDSGTSWQVVPEGTMKPVPAPPADDSKKKEGATPKATLLPHPMPHGTLIQGANAKQWTPVF